MHCSELNVLPPAAWTVVNEGANQVRLHNNNNFLAVVNGNTLVINMVSSYFSY